jgi:ribA/ribD-fused uncharacterized protein
MYDANYAKYTQNELLKKKLLDTNDKILVEVSSYDKIWGIGFTKENTLENIHLWGKNLLGNVLVKVRKDIKNNI